MRFLLHIISGILALGIADKFVEGVEFIGPFFILPTSFEKVEEFFGTLVFVGGFLGFLNYFVKPILNLIALPLRIITLGLFSLIISIFLVWIVDLLFLELVIPNPSDLILTTLILWILTLFIFALFPKAKSFLSK